MMRRFALAIVSALTGLLVFAALTSGATAKSKPPVKKFTAALNVGQEIGVVKATQRGASGRFTATLSGTTLTYTLTFAHLSGPASAAHIHGPATRHQNANVLVPLCGPCTSPVHNTATLTQDQMNMIESGKTYVNVHTSKNPGGEIRGQIVAVG
jgi:hypothetical protein